MAALFCKPAFGLILVTLRTAAIAAGVVGKHLLLTVIALVEVSSKERRTASGNIPKRAIAHLGASENFGSQRTSGTNIEPQIPNALAFSPRGHETVAVVGARVDMGDSRIGNIIYDGFTPVAVLDWEICTLGDPRVGDGVAPDVVLAQDRQYRAALLRARPDAVERGAGGAQRRRDRIAGFEGGRDRVESGVVAIVDGLALDRIWAQPAPARVQEIGRDDPAPSREPERSRDGAELLVERLVLAGVEDRGAVPAASGPGNA